MPGKNEVKEGETEGVRVNYLAIPNKVIRKNGKVQGLEFLKTKLGKTDESGRKKPVPIKGSEFVVRASSIIAAVGQQPDLSWNQEDLPFQLSPRNTFVVDGDGATNIKGIFAAGDAVNGPTTIVEAMASGRRAAKAAGAFLSRKG
jgi:NADPH-dependent glutamate synthase beta subunit-like oxidoreductase